MVYVLDTNIVLLLMGRPAFNAHFVQTYAPEQHDIVISAVSEGELRSLALQRGWGTPKQAQLNAILQQLIIYPVGATGDQCLCRD
ncbi:MAG: hypothetical protein D6722_01480 [Bacteroidetes bacterium]|nr:MAG: hypothetical protein D6722_01480 [Bacteroidota bacterium]